ncbi:MAG TPA: DeoR/GlpR transcriptional regulator [Lachnospiraceae bacterium]|nr:DeoR/GlpR transcriptional regulator [Eubacterium sp.]HBZ02277.1 DeoR/GlpR transcriptional regulator [Lachnospiraceae bacterium]
MLNEERKLLILKEVNDKGSITVQELRNKFDTSESTIRRAITDLSREGKLVKVFGGAVALDSAYDIHESSGHVKEIINKDEKLKIGEYAASLIEPGDYVFIDSGSTTAYMLKFIRERNALYVTNAVSHAKELAKNRFKVLLVGGEMKENTESIVGADAILHIQKYHFTKGFFGTNGVNLKLGFTTPDVREALVKRVAIENTNAGGRFILADHDKFGKTCAVTFSDFGGTLVITDKRPDTSYINVMDVKVVY